ncbi:hypothetical protein [Pontibacter saemangeumensis]
MEDNKKTAAEVEKEGAKVTGDTEATANDAGKPAPEDNSRKGHAPEEANKKEKMTGYNELPEQSKVGGG